MGAYHLVPWRQIYYVNTQTGQQSRDLPQDVDQDISEGGFSPPADSRYGWLIVLVIIPQMSRPSMVLGVAPGSVSRDGLARPNHGRGR